MLVLLSDRAYSFVVEKDQDRHLVSPISSLIGKLRIA
jgi:hypothetical protein